MFSIKIIWKEEYGVQWHLPVSTVLYNLVLCLSGRVISSSDTIQMNAWLKTSERLNCSSIIVLYKAFLRMKSVNGDHSNRSHWLALEVVLLIMLCKVVTFFYPSLGFPVFTPLQFNERLQMGTLQWLLSDKSNLSSMSLPCRKALLNHVCVIKDHRQLV